MTAAGFSSLLVVHWVYYRPVTAKGVAYMENILRLNFAGNVLGSAAGKIETNGIDKRKLNVLAI